ncbi:single-stranded DNA-binding protein [filamentous cyanobacterium LEGE 11480]|uniref:Single-stranded DNA-binding protein n=1 Tax=Romeriopsis navalis LEGE 11480 TaxID=2777977 RepID=A0A928VNM9_9CYAN|nr:single-stranded DNA-binding protein [Romeriopsis navalis]MBE9029722.1 single-stranded DNA-binding protein [Romeriopsis navalis LEGE 11480]
MNSCIMMVQITEAPQLRYTQDNQLAIAEMKVQFAALRPEEPAAEVKAIGWGNTAQDIVNKYQVGDQVIIEGRLGMNTIERPEGFKEKRAELTISRIFELGSMGAGMPVAAAAPAATAAAPKAKAAAPAPATEEDFDEIPF